MSHCAAKKINNENLIPSGIPPPSQNIAHHHATAKLSRSSSQSHKTLNKNNFTNKTVDSSSKTLSNAVSVDDQTVNLSTLPEMTPYERYVCSLTHMNEILLRNKALNDSISAQECCAILIEHVMKLTQMKRDILEKGLLDASKIENDVERAKFQADLRERSLKIRGKLDHASIVAFEVGNC